MQSQHCQAPTQNGLGPAPPATRTTELPRRLRRRRCPSRKSLIMVALTFRGWGDPVKPRRGASAARAGCGPEHRRPRPALRLWRRGPPQRREAQPGDWRREAHACVRSPASSSKREISIVWPAPPTRARACGYQRRRVPAAPRPDGCARRRRAAAPPSACSSRYEFDQVKASCEDAACLRRRLMPDLRALNRVRRRPQNECAITILL